MKRKLALLLTVCMLATGTNLTVAAAEQPVEYSAQITDVTEEQIPQEITSKRAASVVERGKVGTLTWIVDSNGTLTIKGKGAIPDYTTSVDVPWQDYKWGRKGVKIKNVVLEEGITRIGQYSLGGIQSSCSIKLPSTLKSIGSWAFIISDFTGDVTIPAGVTKIEEHAIDNDSLKGTLTIPKTVTGIDKYAFLSSGFTKIVNLSSDKIELINRTNSYWVKSGTNTEISSIKQGTAVRVNASGVAMSQDAVYMFDDVTDKDWFAPAVQYVYQRGIMSGTSSNTFKPQNVITREQFVQVLYSHSGKPAVSGSVKFSDVKKSDWYYNAVLWANKKAIANGVSNGSFGVGQPISREQMALMLYKYAKLKKYSTKKTTNNYKKFPDGAKVSSWAREAMDWATSQKIINGNGNGELKPQGNATRAECAAMIKSMLEKNGK